MHSTLLRYLQDVQLVSNGNPNSIYDFSGRERPFNVMKAACRFLTELVEKMVGQVNRLSLLQIKSVDVQSGVESPFRRSTHTTHALVDELGPDGRLAGDLDSRHATAEGVTVRLLAHHP